MKQKIGYCRFICQDFAIKLLNCEILTFFFFFGKIVCISVNNFLGGFAKAHKNNFCFFYGQL
jgi:hypothetical protein